MQTDEFPQIFRLRQNYPASPPLDISDELRRQFEAQKVLSGLPTGARVAVAVGSRGITDLQSIVRAVIEILKSVGGQPFLLPAMGSHGGATPEGQTEILAGYGVSEGHLGVPVRASMEAKVIGMSDNGVLVHCSAEALSAEAIVLINRIKPHTDFSGSLGSGLIKMLAIGLGKRVGAASCHAAAGRLGHEAVIRAVARRVLQLAPILCGVGIVENQYHAITRLAVLKPADLERREEELLAIAKQLMPKLPFDDIDLLIVDRLGKNISGAGIDPNIIGRGVQGYSTTLLRPPDAPSPFIRRIFVRDLTAETHGNAIGLGFADLTTTRLVRAIDKQATYINALTSLTPHSAKIPIHFETDREAIAQGLASLGLSHSQDAKVVRIADTLSLADLEVSEPYLEQVQKRQDLQALSSPQAIKFDESGNLAPLRSA